METIFKIANYKVINGEYVKTSYIDYKITYLKGTKIHQVRLVVNGYLTKETLSLVQNNQPYRHKMLLAISEYLNNGLVNKNKVTKKLTENYLRNIYSKSFINSFISNIRSEYKEDSRDNITKYGLITQQSTNFWIDLDRRIRRSQRFVKWLIDGYGQHGVSLIEMPSLTPERIEELYNVDFGD